MSSAKQDWRTPANVLELVRKVGPIGLDPCASADNPTGAVNFLTDAGLSVGWAHEHGLTYVNPPYGRALPLWTAKMAYEASQGAEVIGLVPARTDTRWWHEDIATASVICFWRGRLRFVGAPASAPFPSALAYWGPRPGRFYDTFAPHGLVTMKGSHR